MARRGQTRIALQSVAIWAHGPQPSSDLLSRLVSPLVLFPNSALLLSLGAWWSALPTADHFLLFVTKERFTASACWLSSSATASWRQGSSLLVRATTSHARVCPLAAVGGGGSSWTSRWRFDKSRGLRAWALPRQLDACEVYRRELVECGLSFEVIEA